jgi:hypothetical protein
MPKFGVCKEKEQEKKENRENIEKQKATNVRPEIYKAGSQATFKVTQESAFSYLRSNC